jgi:hypothetical protein
MHWNKCVGQGMVKPFDLQVGSVVHLQSPSRRGEINDDVKSKF